jgi:hypothetical protein
MSCGQWIKISFNGLFTKVCIIISIFLPFLFFIFILFFFVRCERSLQNTARLKQDMDKLSDRWKKLKMSYRSMVTSASLIRTDVAGRVRLLFTKKFTYWMGMNDIIVIKME